MHTDGGEMCHSTCCGLSGQKQHNVQYGTEKEMEQQEKGRTCNRCNIISTSGTGPERTEIVPPPPPRLGGCAERREGGVRRQGKGVLGLYEAQYNGTV